MRVIVIGAGLLGTTTAYFLAERGHEVVVLERADAVARETSYANGGIVHASYAAPWNAPGLIGQLFRWAGRRNAPLVVRPTALPGAARWGWRFLRHSRRDRFEASLKANGRLAMYSVSQLRALREHTGLHYDEQSGGALAVFRDAGALARAEREASLLATAGVSSRSVGAEQIVEYEPALARTPTALAGGVYYPDDESGDARLFTERLAEQARARGAVFHLGITVRRLLRDGRGVDGVATDRGEFHGDACVLAAGSYSAALARPLGLRLPICPVKGYSATLALDGVREVPSVPVIDGGRRIVLARLGDRLRIAGFAELAGFDTRPHAKRIRALLRGAAELFPALDEQLDPARVEPWAGLRPMTHDGRPLLGETPVDRLYLATGTGHLGWTFAAGAGRLVADLVSGAEPEIDPAGLTLARLDGHG